MVSLKEKKHLIDGALNKIRNHYVIKDMFEKYDVDVNEVDLIPICFSDLDVSARTDHGIIYLNNALLETPDEIDHYLTHEICHVLQQTTGTKPTKGADSGVYLDNEEEIEGFQNQTEFMADTRDENKAEEYIEQVLDYHDVTDDKEREKRKEKLLHLASL